MAEARADVVILLLAAGASSRMRGADKLLQRIDGVPVLRRQAQAMASLGRKVIVALPPDRPLRGAALEGLNVQRLAVAEAATGMAASIRAGTAAAQRAAGLAILPADMPEITAQDMAQVLQAFAAQNAQRIAQGCGADGTPGHPVIFPARLLGALAALRGDRGARAVLQGEDVLHIPLPARHALTDLDTPEDWADWLAGREYDKQ